MRMSNFEQMQRRAAALRRQEQADAREERILSDARRATNRKVNGELGRDFDDLMNVSRHIAGTLLSRGRRGPLQIYIQGVDRAEIFGIRFRRPNIKLLQGWEMSTWDGVTSQNWEGVNETQTHSLLLSEEGGLAHFGGTVRNKGKGESLLSRGIVVLPQGDGGAFTEIDNLPQANCYKGLDMAVARFALERNVSLEGY